MRQVFCGWYHKKPKSILLNRTVFQFWFSIADFQPLKRGFVRLQIDMLGYSVCWSVVSRISLLFERFFGARSFSSNKTFQLSFAK